MRYPALLRSALGLTGINVGITGRRPKAVLSAFDPFFRGKSASIQAGRHTLNLDLRNPSERLLYYAAPNVLRSYRSTPLYRIMQKFGGGVFVDIGANLGIYSLLATDLGYQAVLFEPEPVHLAFLERNQIGQTFGVALSDHAGTAEFFVSDDRNPGSSSLVSGSGYQGAISVPLKTFDEFDLHPSLIKIDVEGNEEKTIRGMAKFLASPSACPIFCEVRGPSSGRNPNSVQAVTEFLKPFGYEPFTDQMKPYRLGVDPAPQVFDLLYLRP